MEELLVVLKNLELIFCDRCGKTFKKNSEYNDHLKTQHMEDNSKKFDCHICGRKFRYRCLLSAHMVIHTRENKFACHVCGKKFRFKGNINPHMARHKDERKFDCHICGKKFRSKYYLPIHARIHAKDQK